MSNANPVDFKEMQSWRFFFQIQIQQIGTTIEIGFEEAKEVLISISFVMAILRVI